jgi:hypothetical protein
VNVGAELYAEQDVTGIAIHDPKLNPAAAFDHVVGKGEQLWLTPRA